MLKKFKMWIKNRKSNKVTHDYKTPLDEFLENQEMHSIVCLENMIKQYERNKNQNPIKNTKFNLIF
jgi:hypothetical protein